MINPTTRFYNINSGGKVKAKPKEKKEPVVKKEKFEVEVATYTLPEELLPGVGVESTSTPSSLLLLRVVCLTAN